MIKGILVQITATEALIKLSFRAQREILLAGALSHSIGCKDSSRWSE
jgi:hypothetical protein